jgi:hypothetical protein
MTIQYFEDMCELIPKFSKDKLDLLLKKYMGTVYIYTDIIFEV